MHNSAGSVAWQQELGDKLTWMIGRQSQSAELILNPPSLGAVEVRLNMSGGEANAQFYAANPAVRDLLESALPKLREMMGGIGLALGEAMVSNQSFGQRDKAGTGSAQAEARLTDAQSGVDGAEGATAGMALGTRHRLLDFFA